MALRGCRLKPGKRDWLHRPVDVEVLRGGRGEAGTDHSNVAAPRLKLDGGAGRPLPQIGLPDRAQAGFIAPQPSTRQVGYLLPVLFSFLPAQAVPPADWLETLEDSAMTGLWTIG